MLDDTNKNIISTGTLSLEKLIPAFLAEIERRCGDKKVYRQFVRRIDRRTKLWPKYFDMRQSSLDFDQAFQYLCELSPADMYFGIMEDTEDTFGFFKIP